MDQIFDRNTPPVSHEMRAYTSRSGGKVFQLPLELFPGFWGYVYLVIIEQAGQPTLRVLIDTGSGMGSSNDHLEAGLAAATQALGSNVSLSNLTHVFITHGHIDHFGGLGYIFPRTSAKIGVHELDWRIIANYEERLVVAARRLEVFLIEAGLDADHRAAMQEMYQLTKALYHSIPVDFTYEACGMRIGPFEILHVPGHCAGHVVIRLDEILFSGDHILSGISPHQSPERITLSTGLEHYLRSLDALRTWGMGIELVLGGHKEPVYALEQRIDQIKGIHQQRLEQTLDVLSQPATISDVSKALFGKAHGYNVLLALEEAGAHVEYLYQHGRLSIENLSELENHPGPLPIIFKCLSAVECSH